MAVTKFYALHIRKGTTLAGSLRDRIEYAMDPEKTEGGTLVSTFECDSHTAAEEFLLSKRQYRHAVDRQQPSDIIAYALIQSFRPGEITPGEANRIGRELALKFTRGKHAFLVATHVDRPHVHNHIVFNSTSLDGTSKFHSFFFAPLVLRRISDTLCLENGLSVISPDPGRNRSGEPRIPDHAGQNSRLCADIDAAFAQNPRTLSEFLRAMAGLGYEYDTEEQLAFRKTGQKRYTSLSSLKEGYREPDLYARLAGKVPDSGSRPEPAPNLILDLQEKLREEYSAGKQRPEPCSPKQMAKSLLYLRDHDIGSLEELERRVTEVRDRRDALLARVQDLERQEKELQDLKQCRSDYLRTLDIFRDWKAGGRREDFREDHREPIAVHQAAVQALQRRGFRQIPDLSDLDRDTAQIRTEKQQAYTQFRAARDDLREILLVQNSVTSFYDARNRQEIFPREKENPDRDISL